jgi:AraC-like DNA-binding protein
MNNLFTAIKSNDFYKKLSIKDELLFVEFKCLEEDLRYGMWSEASYFVFVTNGKKMWKTYKDEYLVQAGDALFVKKGANIAHQFHSEDYCALMIFISDEFIQSFLHKQQDNLKISTKNIPNKQVIDGVLPIPVDPYLNSYINSLEVFFSQTFDPSRDLLLLKFEELLVNIFCLPKYRSIAEYMLRLNWSNSTQLEIIMKENFAYNLKLEEYAALCHMSLSTFKRNFQKVFNEPPRRWLTRNKITLARNMLESTDKSITQIALDCGFEDPSHFIKVFKKYQLTTPQVYRNENAVAVHLK